MLHAARTTRDDGYAQSQHARPRIEPAFGCLKTIAWVRQVKLRGLPQGGLAVHVRERRVQPDALAKAAAQPRMTTATCRWTTVWSDSTAMPMGRTTK